MLISFVCKLSFQNQIFRQKFNYGKDIFPKQFASPIVIVYYSIHLIDKTLFLTIKFNKGNRNVLVVVVLSPITIFRL